MPLIFSLPCHATHLPDLIHDLEAHLMGRTKADRENCKNCKKNRERYSNHPKIEQKAGLGNNHVDR